MFSGIGQIHQIHDQSRSVPHSRQPANLQSSSHLHPVFHLAHTPNTITFVYIYNILYIHTHDTHKLLLCQSVVWQTMICVSYSRDMVGWVFFKPTYNSGPSWRISSRITHCETNHVQNMFLWEAIPFPYLCEVHGWYILIFCWSYDKKCPKKKTKKLLFDIYFPDTTGHHIVL